MDDMEKKESVESEASEKAAEEVVTEEKAADETVEVSTEAPKGSHIDEEGILEYDDSNASKFDKFFGVTKFGSSIKTELIAGLVGGQCGRKRRVPSRCSPQAPESLAPWGLWRSGRLSVCRRCSGFCQWWRRVRVVSLAL